MNTLKFSNLFLKRTHNPQFLLPKAPQLPKTKPFTSQIFRKFSYSAPWPRPGHKNTSNNSFNALITKQDTALSSALGWDDAKSIEDRFQLSKINDVKKIFSLLRQANYKYPLNDLVHFLRRIVELNEEKGLNLNSRNSMELCSFLQEIKRNLQNNTQDYPFIGSYAWCFWKLNHQEDHDLWLTLGDHIIDERFYPNFNETMCGIEGFTVLDGIADKNFIDQVYKKLEKVLVLTIIEVSIDHYRRITEGLVRVNRFTDYVFENVERHLMNFLFTHTLEHDLCLMLDILACFSMSGNGSEALFYSFQEIFNEYYELDEEQQRKFRNGDFVSKLVRTFAMAKLRYPELVFEEQFKDLVQALVVNDEVQYNLEELLNVVQFVWAFDLPRKEEIKELLDQRLFQVKGHMKCGHIIEYIDMKVERDCEGEYSMLPRDVMAFFDDYLNRNMEKQSHEQVYSYIYEIEDRKLMFGKEELLKYLITYVGTRLHIYDFEELCYFFWVLNKYQTMVKKDDDPKTQGYFNQIKDHIRLYSAFSKGKLQIGSNFYKMLEVVSGSEFLTQGEYPDW